jgi:hypothetical protein
MQTLRFLVRCRRLPSPPTAELSSRELIGHPVKVTVGGGR